VGDVRPVVVDQQTCGVRMSGSVPNRTRAAIDYCDALAALARQAFGKHAARKANSHRHNLC